MKAVRLQTDTPGRCNQVDNLNVSSIDVINYIAQMSLFDKSTVLQFSEAVCQAYFRREPLVFSVLMMGINAEGRAHRRMWVVIKRVGAAVVLGQVTRPNTLPCPFPAPAFFMLAATHYQV
jgi:hypothetical protein